MKSYTSDKDVAKCIQDVLDSDKGWFVKKGKKHSKLCSPTGGIILIPKTPSDYRSLKNFKNQISKATE